jgi:hypothetical protein
MTPIVRGLKALKKRDGAARLNPEAPPVISVER